MNNIPIVLFANIYFSTLCIGETTYPFQIVVMPALLVFYVLFFGHLNIQLIYIFIELINHEKYSLLQSSFQELTCVEVVLLHFGITNYQLMFSTSSLAILAQYFSTLEVPSEL